MGVLEQFLKHLGPGKKVCEIGSKGWDNKPPRHHKDTVEKTGASWTGIDIEKGPGVDVVADVHELSRVVEPNSFDAFICVSTLEHIRKPWIAATELAKVVTDIGYIGTHQSFPLHFYPHDYLRFSIQGLEAILEPYWKVLHWEYTNPCKIVPLANEFVHANNWNFEAEAYLNVGAIVVRV